MESVVDAEVECPPSSENSACPCYKFDDGEFEFKLISKILIIILKTRKFSQLLRNLIVQCERNVKITLTFLV
jgi:hypothetical protein